MKFQYNSIHILTLEIGISKFLWSIDSTVVKFSCSKSVGVKGEMVQNPLTPIPSS